MAKPKRSRWNIFLNKQQQELLSKQEECTRRSASLLRELRSQDAQPLKNSGGIGQAAERQAQAMCVRQINDVDATQKAIEAALARMKAGTYGFCVSCEDRIAEKRLKALPWATHCIACAA